MKAAFISGSSRGIGLEIALQLAKKGYNIALNASSDSDALQSALQAVTKLGVKAVSCAFDVSDIDVHDHQLDVAERVVGPFCTLVNNAGVGVLERGDILDVTPESYDRCFAVNTRAVFFLSQAFARRMIARQRLADVYYSIINITSANARAVSVQRGEYSASKAASAMISKTFAVRLGKEKIAVFDVQPGLIDTDMTASVIASYAKRIKDGLTLFPEVGQPQEIGKVVATLADGSLPYVTGQVISPDGGLLVSRF